MGRPKKSRKRHYRTYYEKDASDSEIPASTLDYRSHKARKRNDSSTSSESEERNVQVANQILDVDLQAASHQSHRMSSPGKRDHLHLPSPSRGCIEGAESHIQSGAASENHLENRCCSEIGPSLDQRVISAGLCAGSWSVSSLAGSNRNKETPCDNQHKAITSFQCGVQTSPCKNDSSHRWDEVHQSAVSCAESTPRMESEDTDETDGIGHSSDNDSEEDADCWESNEEGDEDGNRDSSDRSGGGSASLESQGEEEEDADADISNCEDTNGDRSDSDGERINDENDMHVDLNNFDNLQVGVNFMESSGSYVLDEVNHTNEREGGDPGTGDEPSEDDGDGSEDESRSEEDRDSDDGDESEGSNSGEEGRDRESDGASDGQGGEERNDSDDENDHDPFYELKSKIEASFKVPMNLTVKVMMGEILTNALTLARKHNWSHLETSNVLKFADSLLKLGGTLPSSRHLIDKYFYSKKGMEYHFYCSECTYYLGNVPANSERASPVKCQNKNCNAINETRDLSNASYFVTFDLRGQIESLLSDPKIRNKLMNPVDFIGEPPDGIMRDLHHGSSYRKFAQFVKNSPDTANHRVISLTVSLDSANLTHFSKFSFCPCFLSINELPPVIRMGNLLIAGLWFGQRKEIMDVFLPPIVKHIVYLSVHGFEITVDGEVWRIKVFLITCVADSVARCDIQGLHAHRGDFPCNWCLIEGEEYEGVRIFRYTDPPAPPRTIEGLLADASEALRRKDFVNGVKYLCPLAPAPMFHPINAFIVDYLHAKDEGTTKAFLKEWVQNYTTPLQLAKINRTMKKIKPPKEFRKGIRTFDVQAFWTAREYENFEFFLSIPLFVNLLPQRYLNHWALYVQATFILLRKELPMTAVPLADEMIQEFRRNVEQLYHPFMMRFNMHILEHFAANVERHGPMFALSAYAYEAGNLLIKRLVHSSNFIPSQICRGLSEDQALKIMKTSFESPMTVNFETKIDRKTRKTEIKVVDSFQLLGNHQTYSPSEEECFLLRESNLPVTGWENYTFLKKDGCHFGPSPRSMKLKTDNSFARLSNHQLIHIRRILYHDERKKILVVGSRIRYQPSKYCPASVLRYDVNMCFQFIVNSIDEDVNFYEPSQLADICVSIPLDHGHYISPMPNIFNMF